ncbi:fatty acyl-CoA reductase 2-like isoform X1 [Dinothrombium tinctorium]|uniref:Fatty acyl-CoA reductase n=1 Tax=Dinothrombium tinctorium TaxID=1965070 RepID=A0A3S4Q923_9ACAR|nr:fatty acyl-CoA reductase 2-like isoform X1 [Dinothrombium tinctorium]
MLFAKTIKKIECIIYTSTAYSNCHLKEIPEEIVPLKEEIDVLMTKFKSMKGEELENEALKYFEGRPNNYTFTKALAEHIVVKLHGNIPTAIVRPGVVVPAYEEPYPGFVNTLVGPAGLIVLAGLGVLQIIDFDLSKHVEYTSVDVLTNATLAITTKISKTKYEKKDFYSFTVLYFFSGLSKQKSTILCPPV